MDSANDITVFAHAKPRLRPGVRLTESQPHGGWVLLAPERVFKINSAAVEILRHCDGRLSFSAIVDNLSSAYQAPREIIERDASALVASLANRLLLDL
jgi:pyrroloquinoline quinone biosynthesis protein D